MGARDRALRHAGRTGHRPFRRVVTDHARVTRGAGAAPSRSGSGSGSGMRCQGARRPTMEG
ncbi:DUF7848 domain-containing protein [Streptomyces sp. NBC_01439]|uniref:DUF7848 domain-containing protein n=1 Tax=Streptomyces sp. NBC_01439 TaxID=2903867 RepID=UPI003FCCB495